MTPRGRTTKRSGLLLHVKQEAGNTPRVSTNPHHANSRSGGATTIGKRSLDGRIDLVSAHRVSP
jgi:hypothetical protein